MGGHHGVLNKILIKYNLMKVVFHHVKYFLYTPFVRSQNKMLVRLDGLGVRIYSQLQFDTVQSCMNSSTSAVF